MSNAQVDLSDLQGDILVGLQKRTQAFLFLSVSTVDQFKTALTKFAPSVKESRQKAGQRVWLPIRGRNIAFSARGLTKLGVGADQLPPDPAFGAGQKTDGVQNLGDPTDAAKTLTTWKKPFLSETIDLVISLTAPDTHQLHAEARAVTSLFGTSVRLVYSTQGHVRPEPETGHEHFGFLDGISNPTLANGQLEAKLGQDQIHTDILITGLKQGDPAWIANGSYMVFRELQQLVPEFHKFTEKVAQGAATQAPGIDGKFVGARLIGRWQSGAPLVETPLKDDKSLAGNNNFDYADDLVQEKCPYAAHVRKLNPRVGSILDRDAAIRPHLILTTLAYGHEVDVLEGLLGRTEQERGLLFVSYQASIVAGFQFVQKFWANLTTFPPNTLKIAQPGSDMLIGQAVGERSTQGIIPNATTDPNNLTKTTANFVVPKGGEYFFVPAISQLTKKLGLITPAVVDQSSPKGKAI